MEARNVNQVSPGMQAELSVGAAMMVAQEVADSFKQNVEKIRNQAGTDPVKIAAFNQEVEAFQKLILECSESLKAPRA